MFQGVSYQADVAGIIALGRPGGEIAKKLIAEAWTKCPNAKIHLSGYSQGAIVMHNAVTGNSAAHRAKIAAIATLGDPFQRQQFNGIEASKFKTFCASGDLVCQGGGATITPAHLQYTTNGDVQKGAAHLIANAA